MSAEKADDVEWVELTNEARLVITMGGGNREWWRRARSSLRSMLLDEEPVETGRQRRAMAEHGLMAGGRHGRVLAPKGSAFLKFFDVTDVVLEVLKFVGFPEASTDDMVCMSCAFGWNDILDICLRCGGSVSSIFGQFETCALMYACARGNLEAVELLIRRGVNVDQPMSDGVTPLYYASMNGFVDIQRRLLDAGATAAEPMATNGSTALHFAAVNGHPGTIRTLVDAGVSPTSNGAMGSAHPIHWAAFVGCAAGARELLECGADVNAANDRGMTSLHFAAWKGWNDLADVLLEYKGDLERRKDNGWTPYLEAVAAGHVEVAKKYMDAGAKLDVVSETNETALYLAVRNGDADTVRLVLESGADANERHGAVPQEPMLVVAAHYGKEDACRVLLEFGADPLLEDFRNQNAIGKALQQNYAKVLEVIASCGVRLPSKTLAAAMIGAVKPPTVIAALEVFTEIEWDQRLFDALLPYLQRLRIDDRSYISEIIPRMLARFPEVVHTVDSRRQNLLFAVDSVETCAMLLDAGVKPDVHDIDGETPLFRAPDASVVRFFVETTHIDVNTSNNQGETAIFHIKDPEVLTALLLHGADPNHTDNNGATPLHFATSETTVRTLTEAGADVNAKDNDGDTPLHYLSKTYFDLAIAQLIIEGADPHALNNQGHKTTHEATHGALARLREAGVEPDN